MLLALPSAVAFGLIVYAPLGKEFSSMAAIGGIIGTITLGLITPLLGSTKGLVSAPCAPAAAVLSLFVAELVKSGMVPMQLVPVYITLVSLAAGLLQIVIAAIGGGDFIKYIPYPVVTGYLSAVSVLILSRQIPKVLGFPRGVKLWQAITSPNEWKWESMIVGLVTILTMMYAPKIRKKTPPIIFALAAGLASYFLMSIFEPGLRTLTDNPLLIGKIAASTSDIVSNIGGRWLALGDVKFNGDLLQMLVVPIVSLSVLLCINTLNACVVLDTLSYTRHDSKKEIQVQGVGNAIAAMLGGIPGAGLLNASIMSQTRLRDKAVRRMPALVVGITGLAVLLFFARLVAWIPIPALAGILIMVSLRLIDRKNFALLKNRSTWLDFAVIIIVVLSAVLSSLLVAACVGTGMAIFLFFREQMRASVIRRLVKGNEVFSKKRRLAYELAVLRQDGDRSLIVELQGQLFFGTADQLISTVLPYLDKCNYVTLDMRKLQSVDLTAVNMLKQINGRLKGKGGYLLLSAVPMNLPTGKNIKDYLNGLGLVENESLLFADTLNSALEWVEDDILACAGAIRYDDRSTLELKQMELFEGFPSTVLEALGKCAVAKSFAAGSTIFNIGTESDELYLVRKGTIKLMIPLKNGTSHHLLTVGKGGIFGEMAFIDQIRRSADAVAVEDALIFVLSRKTFNAAIAAHPEVAAKFFERLAFIIANRLRQTNIEVKDFQDT